MSIARWAALASLGISLPAALGCSTERTEHQGAAGNRASVADGGVSASAGTSQPGSLRGGSQPANGSGGSGAGPTLTARGGGTAGAVSAVTVQHPLYATSTQTTGEWITGQNQPCDTERSACALPCPDDGRWVALNPTDFQDSATCGACMEVTGPSGVVVVEVIENCAGACAAGEIELSRSAFDAIADLDEGQAPMTWHLVPCERTAPLSFAFESDSDEWWAGIQVRNARLPVASLAIRLPEKGWTALSRDRWNHFPVSANLGSGPFDFRVRAIDGQELLEEGIAYVPGGVVAGRGQFR